MIAALADAGAALGGADGQRYLRRRRARAPSSCCASCATRDGRLLRTYNHGRAKLDAYLEDHAFLLEALIALFEATCEERWFDEARALADEMIARFADPERGGFFSTAATAKR